MINMEQYLEEEAAENSNIRIMLEKDQKAPFKGSIGKQAHSYSSENNFVHAAGIAPEKRTKEVQKKTNRNRNLEETYESRSVFTDNIPELLQGKK